MSILDIFKKDKKEEKEDQVEEIKETNKEETVEISEEEPEENNEILDEYSETLETTSKSKKTENPKNEHVWRNVEAIEENVDNIHIKNAKKPSSEVEKRVDTIIEKTKKKHRKPSNVIYVVNNPQPGQVRGDWAVRGHGKIFSHHRTKENAIKKAREIAVKKEATVMVQNTDGTFSDGFKPRSK